VCGDSPDLRPLVPLDGGVREPPISTTYRASSTATSLERLMKLRAPDIIIRNESACCRRVDA